MKKDNKPNTDKTPPLDEIADLDPCTQAPEFAEHASPNAPGNLVMTAGPEPAYTISR